MEIYIIILFWLLGCTILYDVHGLKKHRLFIYEFTGVVMTIVAVFSYKIGIDTFFYMNMYEKYPTLDKFDFTEINEYYHEPLWVLLNVVLRTFDCDFIVVKLIVSVFFNYILFRLIYEQTRYIFTCVLLYFLLLWITTNFESIRQTMAIAFYLWGCMSLIKGDKKQYLWRAFPMIFFHKTGILVYLITIVIQYYNINKKTFVYLGVVFAITVISATLFKDLVPYISLINADMGTRYEIYMSHGSEGLSMTKNINAIVFPLFIKILIPSYLCYYYQKHDKEWLARFLLLYVIFAIVQFSFVVFARLMQYVMVFYFIAVSNLILELLIKHKAVIANILVTLSVLLNIYIEDSYYFSKKNEFLVNGADIRYIPYKSVFSEDKNIHLRNIKLNHTQPLKARDRIVDE